MPSRPTGKRGMPGEFNKKEIEYFIMAGMIGATEVKSMKDANMKNVIKGEKKASTELAH